YGSALHAAARARDPKGWLLPERVAATTVLNVVRPTVAVAWFVEFARKALDEYPEWRERIATGDDAALDAFVQEVQRLYPFVPVLAARARAAQDVLGVRVPRGGLVVLDVHGTNHDPEHWPEPDRFDPDGLPAGSRRPRHPRSQGGGDVTNGHRCPGEGVVLRMLALAGLQQTLAPQDLDYDLSRIPTRPRSGVVITPTPATVSAEQAGGLRTRQRHRAAGSPSLPGDRVATIGARRDDRTGRGAQRAGAGAREQVVAGLGKREGLVGAQYFPGMYVVCSDGQEVGTLRATHVSGGGGARRSGWGARRVGTWRPRGSTACWPRAPLHLRRAVPAEAPPRGARRRAAEPSHGRTGHHGGGLVLCGGEDR
ncbi:cytochrome P450, partial [Pseudonocardia sp.]|uniref:cytochrome P450 n=1 Tax=Pseudonocardia sp. TaxID=60912 RepID=UPI002604ECA9